MADGGGAGVYLVASCALYKLVTALADGGKIDLFQKNRNNCIRRSSATISLRCSISTPFEVSCSRRRALYREGKWQSFVVVPYTLRNNDILLMEGRNFTAGQFLEEIKLDFDQLYEEGTKRRRMMLISAHDRISGAPAMVRVWDEFLHYVKSHPGVAFMRKDGIAK